MDRKIIFSVVLLIFFLVGSFLAHAAECLVYQAKVTSVTNTANDLSVFAVRTTGGTGPCAENYVIFDVQQAPDPDSHNRAFALAMTALVAGKKVTIFNYIDSGCSKAAFIELLN